MSLASNDLTTLHGFGEKGGYIALYCFTFADTHAQNNTKTTVIFQLQNRHHVGSIILGLPRHLRPLLAGNANGNVNPYVPPPPSSPFL